VGFYRDVLGLPLLVESGGSAVFDGGPVRLLLLTSAGDAHDGSGAMVSFDVEEIEGAYERLTASGVAFESGPHLLARMADHELWTAAFRDPDGNRLALLCRKP